MLGPLEYRGFRIGPQSADAKWDKQLSQYLLGAHACKIVGEGLLAKALFYNGRVLARLSHVMQLEWRPGKALFVEDRALSISASTPFRAIPKTVLADMKNLGGGGNGFRLLSDTNLATLIRTATRTAKNLDRCLSVLDCPETWLGDEASLSVVGGVNWGNFDSPPMAYTLRSAVEACLLPVSVQPAFLSAIQDTLASCSSVKKGSETSPSSHFQSLVRQLV